MSVIISIALHFASLFYLCVFLKSQVFLNCLAVKMAIIAGISGFSFLLLCLFCVSKIRLVFLLAL